MPITAQCHCGKTKFQIEGEIPAQLTRCTCSFCSKRGVLWAYYKIEQLRLLTPEADLAEYRWRSKTVSHYFCGTCGCGTYSRTPDYPASGEWDGQTLRYGVNARLFDNFVADEHPVFVIDGKNLW